MTPQESGLKHFFIWIHKVMHAVYMNIEYFETSFAGVFFVAKTLIYRYW